jgi:hypothetical protein
MKRPNLQKMRKHRAKSTPDRVKKTFEQSSVLYYEEMPEVRKFMDEFAKNMRIKHGHEPDIEMFVQQDWMQLSPGVFTLELVYKGKKDPLAFLRFYNNLLKDELVTRTEAERRFGFWRS